MTLTIAKNIINDKFSHELTHVSADGASAVADRVVKTGATTTIVTSFVILAKLRTTVEMTKKSCLSLSNDDDKQSGN